MGLLSDWTAAKKKFETKTGKKKPSEKIAGAFRKGSGLQGSLKKMEKATTFEAMESAVADFKKAAHQFESLCNAALKKENKTREFKAELRELMNALDDIAQAAMQLEPLGTVEESIYDEDITKRVLDAAGNPPDIKLKQLKISASVKMDKRILAEFKANPRLRQQFIDTPAKERGPAIKALADKLEECSEAARMAAIEQNEAGVSKAQKAFDTFAKRELDRLAESTEKAVLKAWNNFVGVHKAYKKYKIKVVTNMTVGALVLTGSILLVASGPMTGAGFIFGIFGICKQSVALLGELAKAFMAAETMQKKLHVDFKQYLAIAKGAKSGTTFELVGKVLSSQTGGLIGDWVVPTLGSIEKNNGTFKSKLDGVEVKLNTFARKVETNLGNQDKVQKERQEIADWVVAAGLVARPEQAVVSKMKKNKKALAELTDTLGKYEKGLDKLLKASDNMNEVLQVGRNAHAAFSLAITELKSQNIKGQKLFKYLDAAIAIADMSAGAGIAGGGGGFQSWEAAVKPIMATVLKAEKATWTEILKRS